MKKNNNAAVTTIDFTVCDVAMDAIGNAEQTLAKTLTAIRAAHPDLDPISFRKQWEAYVVSKGRTAKWAGVIATAAGIRLREAGGGRKAAEKKEPAAFDFNAWLKAMPAKLDAAQKVAIVTALASR